MTPEQKKHNSRKMKLRWMKARKYAAILGKPKEEVWNNLDLCVENSKGLLSGRPDVIASVLKGGKWKVTLDEKTYWENVKKKHEEEDVKNEEWNRTHMSQYDEDEDEDEDEDKLIKERDQEKYQKEKAEACGYTTFHTEKFKNTSNSKVNGDDPFSGLKIAMWFIKQIGSLEKAEKLFQAAKLTIEAAKS